MSLAILIDDIHYMAPLLQQSLIEKMWSQYGEVLFLSDFVDEVKSGNRRILINNKLHGHLSDHGFKSVLYTHPFFIAENLSLSLDQFGFCLEDDRDIWQLTLAQVSPELTRSKLLALNLNCIPNTLVGLNLKQIHQMPWLDRHSVYFKAWTDLVLKNLEKDKILEFIEHDQTTHKVEYIVLKFFKNNILPDEKTDRALLTWHELNKNSASYYKKFRDRTYVRQRLRILDDRMKYLIQFKTLKERVKWRFMYQLVKIRDHIQSRV